MKSYYSILLAVILVFCVGRADAGTITLLDDYRITSDINDVVHLGDRTDLTYYYNTLYGSSITFNFDLLDLSTLGDYSLYITHWQAQPPYSYNHVFLNGNDLGYLSASYNYSTLSAFWETDIFTGNPLLLREENNELSIYAGGTEGAYDDFDITNVYLDYSSSTPVPEPSSMLLLSISLIGLAGFRKKFRIK